MGGHVDRGIALGQLQSDGLPLLDVAQHLAIVGAHSEAELSSLFHAFLSHNPRLLGVAAPRDVSGRPSNARPLRGGVPQLRQPAVDRLGEPPHGIGVLLALLADSPVLEPLVEGAGLKHSGSSSFVVFLGGVALQSPVLVSGRLPASIGRHGGQ